MEWIVENWMYIVAAIVAILEVALPFISSTKANGVLHGIIEFLKGLSGSSESKEE